MHSHVNKSLIKWQIFVWSILLNDIYLIKFTFVQIYRINNRSLGSHKDYLAIPTTNRYISIIVHTTNWVPVLLSQKLHIPHTAFAHSMSEPQQTWLAPSLILHLYVCHLPSLPFSLKTLVVFFLPLTWEPSSPLSPCSHAPMICLVVPSLNKYSNNYSLQYNVTILIWTIVFGCMYYNIM